jgi:hypothetical protein
LEFGPPLPGRTYSVERSLADAPKVVVARVLDDGPMPMGPMVYLSAGSRNVSTVLCRCMRAQAKNLAGTYTYELTPLPANAAESVPGIEDAIGSSERLRMFIGSSPVNHLRLPAFF